MGARAWWTVVLTVLAAPLGSVGLGVGLARWADATTGGMASLAGGVVGLWLGAPLASIAVFALCLVTLARPVPLRRWVALLLMIVAAAIEAFVVLIGLRVTGGMATPELGVIAVATCAVGVLGGGALVALRLSRQPEPPVDAAAGAVDNDTAD